MFEAPCETPVNNVGECLGGVLAKLLFDFSCGFFPYAHQSFVIFFLFSLTSRTLLLKFFKALRCKIAFGLCHYGIPLLGERAVPDISFAPTLRVSFKFHESSVIVVVVSFRSADFSKWMFSSERENFSRLMLCLNLVAQHFMFKRASPLQA